MLKRVSYIIVVIATITLLTLLFYSPPIYAQTFESDTTLALDLKLSINAEEHARIAANGWQQGAGGSRYLDEAGQPCSGWQKIDGEWYLFTLDGYMLTGWQQDGGVDYLLGKDGALRTGWQKYDGSWYYLDAAAGKRTGWMKDEESGKWYLFGDDGVMQTGWYEEADEVDQPSRTYYFSPAGVMSVGWAEVDGETYYFHPDGSMAESGWHIIDGRAEFLMPQRVDYMLSVISLEHIAPEGFEPPDMIDIETIRTTNSYTLGSWGKRANAEAAVAMDEMLAAAADEGIGNFFINSAYRSKATQLSLYQRKRGGSPSYAIPSTAIATMPPGASEHEGGLTFDIMTNSMRSVSQSISYTPQGKWLAENAHRFGFIMRYTRSKEHITHVIHEPWHYRYVGKEAAQEMYEQDLCLEEYLGLVD